MNPMQSAESLTQQTKLRRNTTVMPPSELSPLATVDVKTANTTSEDPSPARRKIRWQWGVLAAVAMALLSLYPQIDLMVTRGANWQGSYTSLCYDEEEYAGYIQGLLLGRPRRHEPYGLIDPNKTQYETFLSLQVVP